MKEIYLNCDCEAEVLRIEFDDESQDYFISIYGFKYNSRYSIRDRLRNIWRIIRAGEPYGDQMVISKDKMKELIDFIKEEE